MKTMIVSKMSCNDDILKASRTLNVEAIKDVISAAMIFTPFSVHCVDIVYARVSEKYFLDCKKLGYTDSFFRKPMVLVLCRLIQSRSQYNTSNFDAVYIPFSGEIYLLPCDVFEVEPVPDKDFEAILSKDGQEIKLRRFNMTVGHDDEPKLSRWERFRSRISGDAEINIEHRISSLEATADVRVKILGNGTTEEEVLDPMYFLYEE